MITYSEKFEKRRKKLNDYIKKSYGVEDSNMLIVLHAIGNVENKHDENKLNGVKGTSFKDMPIKELLSQFQSQNFNDKNNLYYEELFQEVYNRQTLESGYEPRYIVEVSGENGTTNGFMQHGTNMLNINAGVIERYKMVDESLPINKNRRNAQTIGAHSLLTLIHETQHTFQSEGMMRFALNEDKNNIRERSRNAIALAKLSLWQYLNSDAADQTSEDYANLKDLLENSYWFDSMEHDSNMAPVRYINKQIQNNNIPDEVFLKAEKQRVVNDIHINNLLSEKDIPTTLDERAKKMEDVVKGYQKYFHMFIKDGELKNQVCEVLDNYLKPDEKGKSQYIKDIKKDFRMCLRFIDYAKHAIKPDVETKDEKKSGTLVIGQKPDIITSIRDRLKGKKLRVVNKSRKVVINKSKTQPKEDGMCVID